MNSERESVKVTPKTYAGLLRVKAVYFQERRKKLTMDGVISLLLEEYERMRSGIRRG